MQGRSSFRFVCSQELQTSTMTAAFVLIPFVGSSKLKLTPRNHTPVVPQLDRLTLPREGRLASLRQLTGYLFCAHSVWRPQQAKAIAPKLHIGEECSRARFPMEFVRDPTKPPSPALILGLATSASQGSRSGNHTAKFGAPSQPRSASEEELFGLTAATVTLLCGYSAWGSQQAGTTAPHAHSQGQSHKPVNSGGSPTIPQQPRLPLCSSGLTTPAS